MSKRIAFVSGRKRTACLCLFVSLLIVGCEFSKNEPPDGEMEKLKTLPYLQGTVKAGSKTGVTISKITGRAPGYNLYVSGHAAQAILVDMQGQVVHQWQADFDTVFPDVPASTDKWYDQDHWRNYWRRVHLEGNGDLLAIWEGNGLVRLNKRSEVLWACPGMFHHDLEVLPDGSIAVLNRRLARIGQFNSNNLFLEDLVTILDSSGNIRRNYSIPKMWLDSPYSDLLKYVPNMGDCFHTNTLEVFDGSKANLSPLFKKDNVLLSMRMFDAIAIADLGAEKIVWAQRPGIWAKQHQPTLLANGRMILFNNDAKTAEKDDYNASSILEFDPLSMKVLWKHEGTREDFFYSRSSGSCQRLADGNTLITESETGRVFEVTTDGQIAWEFINPNRTGENNELTAAIFEMVRIEPSRHENFFLTVP